MNVLHLEKKKGEGDGMMFEYTQLKACYTLINIISYEALLTITIDTCGSLVAINNINNKNVIFPPKYEIKHTSYEE